MAKDQQQEWIRLQEYELPGCRVFVTPSSYALMTMEGREAAWAADVASGAGPAAMWIVACTAVADARSQEPCRGPGSS